MSLRVRTAILISGRGSNMMSLIEAAASPGYPAEMVLVVSNRPEAPGLALARAAGVETLAIDHRAFGGDRAAHEAKVDAALRAHRIQLVCLAGYMRLLTPWLVERWAGRMLNVHPSLLPALKGLDTHARALADGHRVHGCTVHLVSADMDEGPILEQVVVPVTAEDDEHSLAARVLEAEHRLYPRVVAAFIAATPMLHERLALPTIPGAP